MNHKEPIMKVIKLNLKLQWQDQINVIIVMHTYMLKELQVEITIEFSYGS